jgi:hypothetical protein
MRGLQQLRRHPVNSFAQDFIAPARVQQEMRRIRNDTPALFTGEILEQPADASTANKLVACADYGEHRRCDCGGLAYR